MRQQKADDQEKDPRAKWRRGMTVGVMVFGATFGFATAAMAATYSSSANFTNQVSTPGQHANYAGGHTLVTKGSCDANRTTPTAELVQDFYFQPNHYLGRRNIGCRNTNVTSTWSSNDSGDHFINFYSNGNGVSVSFTWTYPR